MIKTSRQNLIELFEALEIPRGGVVMLHSSLFSLGIIENGISGFYNTLREYIGFEATLVVPTFTYSFRRNEVFDILNTPSAKNIGVLSEYVRNQPDAIRSSDPLFSMSAVGPEAVRLMDRKSNNCFGLDSIYGNLFEINTTFIGLGITYSTGLSGFMHLEKLANVPYRADMRVHGDSISANGVPYQDFAIHFARDEKAYGNTETNREQFGLMLEQRGASSAINYGYGRHISLKGALWKDISLDELNKNPLSMLTLK